MSQLSPLLTGRDTRDTWLVDPDVAYLSHGSFGALPQQVADAADEIRRRLERNPFDLLTRGIPAMYDDVREQVAELLGADAAGCVFIPNATTGTATVLGSLEARLEPGDEILTTDHYYVSVAAQLDRMSDRLGTTTVAAHVPLDVTTDSEVVAHVMARLGPRTRLLVVDAIASASGMVFPIAELVSAAHAAGVPVLVDAAHAPGQVPVDVHASGADFWVGNLHKWVCSPRAAAVLYVAPPWRDQVRPLVASHGFADGFQRSFVWTGTHDPVPVLSVPAALEFWAGVGWDNARRRQRSLVEYGARLVADAVGVTSPLADFSAAMRVIELPPHFGAPQAEAVERSLSVDHRIEISVTTFHDRHWVRICGQLYNSSADYERLAVALPRVIADVDDGH